MKLDRLIHTVFFAVSKWLDGAWVDSRKGFFNYADGSRSPTKPRLRYWGNFQQVQGDTIPSQPTTSLFGASTSNLSPSTFTYGRVPNSNLIATVTGPVHTVNNTCEINRDVLTNKQNRVTTGANANAIVRQYDYNVNAIGQRISRTQSGTAFDGIGYAPGTQPPSSMTGAPDSGTSTDILNYNPHAEVINCSNIMKKMEDAEKKMKETKESLDSCIVRCK